MKNDKFTAKGLNMDELDQVSGGTVIEFIQLCEAIAPKKIKGSDISELMASAFDKCKSGMPIINEGLRTDVVKLLKQQFGIDAAISLGFAGTGIDSRHNTYRDVITRKPLTHDQVLNRIRNYI